MKALATTTFVLIMSTTSAFAWGEGCSGSKASMANLCEAGWSWDEQAGACVGVHFIKSISKEMTYEHKDEAGTLLTLVF